MSVRNLAAESKKRQFQAGRQQIIGDLLHGQYSNPVRVIAYCGGLVADVSEDVAHELQRSCAEMGRDLPSSLEEFVAKYQGQHRAE